MAHSVMQLMNTALGTLSDLHQKNFPAITMKWKLQQRKSCWIIYLMITMTTKNYALGQVQLPRTTHFINYITITKSNGLWQVQLPRTTHFINYITITNSNGLCQVQLPRTTHFINYITITKSNGLCQVQSSRVDLKCFMVNLGQKKFSR